MVKLREKRSVSHAPCAGLRGGHPQKMRPSKPVTVTLFGKAVFADGIQNLEMSSSWITQGAASTTRILTEGTACKGEGQGWSDAATSHGAPGAARSWRKQEDVPWNLQREQPHLYFRLPASTAVRG